MLAAYALVIASHYGLGELSLDEASTFFISALDWPQVIARSLSFQSQPPLFYLLLHGWIRIGDTEPILRALPLLCMVGAALTLLSASFLSPITRIVSASLLLLTTYGDYLSLLIRPYALSAWLSLGSFLLFTLLLTGPRRRFVWYASFVVVTSLMVYSLAMTAWTLLAEGLCAAAAFGVELSRTDARRARERHGAVLWALAAVALLYVPYVIAVWHLQGHLGHPSIRSTLIAATNPRYFVSGPLYVLAIPWRLGYVAAAAMAYGVWSGFRRGDPMVGILVMIVIVQISMTHGFLEGRSEFGFRYLAPAFPALCILAGLGADRSLSRFSFAGWGVAAGAALVLLAATASFVRAPGAPPVGPWRPVRTDVEKLPGTKVVFFDVGWEAQPLRYEMRDVHDVRFMTDPGDGWSFFGRLMTPAYVTGVIDREAGPATIFFYGFDPVTNGLVFRDAFEPAMTRRGCARVYERAIPTSTRSVANASGALLYGYSCHAR